MTEFSKALVERVAKVIDPDAWHEKLPKDGLGMYWIKRRIDARTKAEAALTASGLDDLDWFGTRLNLELYFYTPVYGDDDDQAQEWRVDRVNGSINDREWTTVGRGETPLAAIQSARTLTDKLKG